MEKVWQIKPGMPKDFAREYPEYPPVVLQLLWNRGLKAKDGIVKFLEPDPKNDRHDPSMFGNMAAAVDLIISHIKAGNKIVVYGDYDADGVSAASLLVETLAVLRAQADVYIPHRVTEGYGINSEAVGKIAAMDTKLMITVDGGIRNQFEVEEAKKLGMDVIITDHHMPPESKDGYPDCLIINPLAEGEKYPFKKLAGAGVAYKLAVALIRRSKLAAADKTRLEERILDLVAIGTVADCVELTGENRLLVKEGLEILNVSSRAGLVELIKIAGLEGKTIDSWNIGFQIGPRLNAAGRMGSANTAYELLITGDSEEAKSLAERLNERNIERQVQTELIMAEVESQIDPKSDDSLIVGLCPDNNSSNEDDWNEGIIGLVAGKITSKYYRPALVITKSQDGYKGSGRSIEEYNIVEGLEATASFLEKFGGHPAACGFSLKKENLDGFIKAIKEHAARALKGFELRPRISIEAEMPLGQVNDDLMTLINRFAPFGVGNERPLFLSREVDILDIVTMGLEGQHIKLRLKSGDSAVFSAIGFGQSETWQHLKIGDKIDIVYYIELNVFNGRSELQLKIIDIKKSFG